MREEFEPAIKALQGDLAELERQAFETKQVINRLCTRAGMEPLYPDATLAASPSMGTLRSDSFYGKAITTAAREYLEMRRSAALGPATPREVYEALAKGGYTFDTAEEVHAIISVRSTLRKNSGIFHKLPNGTYGLLSRYPKAKAARNEEDEEAVPSRQSKSPKTDVAATARKATKAPKGIKAKRRKAKAGGDTSRPSVAPFISNVMSNGEEWTTESLKQEAISQRVTGIDASTPKNVFHGTLLNLKRKGQVEQAGNGSWRTPAKTERLDQEGKIVRIKGTAS